MHCGNEKGQNRCRMYHNMYQFCRFSIPECIKSVIFCYCVADTLSSTLLKSLTWIWWKHTNKNKMSPMRHNFFYIFFSLNNTLTLVLLRLRYFCNTSSEGRGCCTPFLDFLYGTLDICYKCIGMGLSIHWYQTEYHWTSYDVIKSVGLRKFGCIENIHEH